jgi:hypothetical protein
MQTPSRPSTERCRADSIRNQLLSSADDEARRILDVRAADLQEEMAEQRLPAWFQQCKGAGRL